LPNEKKPKEPIRVTDRRIFTAEGDLKDEYRGQVKPVAIDPGKAPEPRPEAAPQPEAQRNVKPDQRFLMLLDLVAANLSNALELARRGAPEGREASSQLIEILDVIGEKTKGNLASQETESLRALAGEAKLRFVQLTKDIKV
jgi:hypothetical protein